MRGTDFNKLSKRQIEALKANAPTANDILDNEEFFNELNEEIEYTNKKIQEINKPEETKPSKPVIRDLKMKIVEEQFVESELELDEEVKRAREVIAAREAAKAAAVQVETTKTQPESQEKTLRDEILATLKAHPKAPSELDIRRWKESLGERNVWTIAMNEDDVFVFTCLRHGAFQKLKEAAATIANADPSKNPEDILREKILQQCILFPKLTLEFWYGAKAGTQDTLYQVIMAHSNFLTVQQAMILTTRL